jgi:hypothetical protein
MNAQYVVQRAGLAGLNWTTVCRGADASNAGRDAALAPRWQLTFSPSVAPGIAAGNGLPVPRYFTACPCDPRSAPHSCARALRARRARSV